MNALGYLKSVTWIVGLSVLFVTDAMAQRRGVLTEIGTMRMTVSFQSQTGFGLAEDVIVVDFSNGTGEAVVTGYPDTDQFVAGTLHEFDVDWAGAFAVVPVIDGLTDFRVEVNDISVSGIERTDAFLGQFGMFRLDDTPVTLTGTISFSEDFFFGLDASEKFTAVIGQAAADIGQDGILIFEIDQPLESPGQFDSFELPLDISTLTYNVRVEWVRFEGNPFSAFGDDDADGDIDNRDYGQFQICTGEEIEEPFCFIFDFDEDEDVDLIDWGGLQAAFGSGR